MDHRCWYWLIWYFWIQWLKHICRYPCLLVKYFYILFLKFCPRSYSLFSLKHLRFFYFLFSFQSRNPRYTRHCNTFYVQLYNALPSETSEFLISNYITWNAIYLVQDFVQRKYQSQLPTKHPIHPVESELRQIVMRAVWFQAIPRAFAIDRASTL